jgi:hypothetical protein
MPRKDQLAQGAAKASYGPIPVSQSHWESIFGPPEDIATIAPSNRPSNRTGKSKRRTRRVKDKAQ